MSDLEQSRGHQIGGVVVDYTHERTALLALAKRQAREAGSGQWVEEFTAQPAPVAELQTAQTLARHASGTLSLRKRN